MINPNSDNPTNEALITGKLKATIDILIDEYGGSEHTFREHEEEAIMDAPATFDECPTATRLKLSRPIPGEEDIAATKYPRFHGHRVSVIENGGQIQTDFVVSDDKVLKRQIISMPGDFEPLMRETEVESLIRRGHELLGDALSMLALDSATRAAEIKRRNSGEPIDPDITKDLTTWVLSAQPADLSY